MNRKSDEEFFVEHCKKFGTRHPNHRCNPDEFLPPNHPYTKSLIKQYTIQIDYHKRKMTQEQFWDRYKKAENKSESEKEKLMKNCDKGERR